MELGVEVKELLGVATKGLKGEWLKGLCVICWIMA
jgi:hypothetical protein